MADIDRVLGGMKLNEVDTRKKVSANKREIGAYVEVLSERPGGMEALEALVKRMAYEGEESFRADPEIPDDHPIFELIAEWRAEDERNAQR